MNPIQRADKISSFAQGIALSYSIYMSAIVEIKRLFVEIWARSRNNKSNREVFVGFFLRSRSGPAEGEKYSPASDALNLGARLRRDMGVREVIEPGDRMALLRARCRPPI